MTGTNKKLSTLPDNTPLAPVVILVRPQLGENIGMCARAMLNCAVTELRIVAPRDGWPSESALSASSGAVGVIEKAQIFDSVQDAVADLEHVFATTARERDMIKNVYSTNAAAKVIHEKNAARVQKCGILFGPERSGLENDDVAQANAIINIPLNPGFSSLNLAQAVLLTCHAWLSADNIFADGDIVNVTGKTQVATREEIENLMEHLERALDENGFFRTAEKKPTLTRNIRNFFFRSDATQQDINTLHGVFACLTGKKTWG